MDCRWFSGYKPCKFARPCEGCPDYTRSGPRIAILSLEAMGAVIRATCLLAPVRQQYPDAHITWITLPQCRGLLEQNPEIDRTIFVEAKTVALLNHLHFDTLYAVDKSPEAGALAEQIVAKRKFGFGLTDDGAIRPLNPEATYQYDLGLDDQLKFFTNEKPETQQLTETMGLKWERDPYLFRLSQEERDYSSRLRQEILTPQPGLEAAGVIGYNTGCSLLYPNKKLTTEHSVELIRLWRRHFPRYCVALLGGPEDTRRQKQMKELFLDDPFVQNTPTEKGLRQGFIWMNTADIVFSGCSLGMHMAIALGKKVIAWFGVSCLQEIDLYGRGIRIQSDVSCSPCWKKSCSRKVMCYDRVGLDRVIWATRELLEREGPYPDLLRPASQLSER